MDEYIVEIRETIVRKIQVVATDRQNAEDIAKGKYETGELKMDEDNSITVQVSAIKDQSNRNISTIKKNEIKKVETGDSKNVQNINDDISGKENLLLLLPFSSKPKAFKIVKVLPTRQVCLKEVNSIFYSEITLSLEKLNLYQDRAIERNKQS